KFFGKRRLNRSAIPLPITPTVFTALTTASTRASKRLPCVKRMRGRISALVYLDSLSKTLTNADLSAKRLRTSIQVHAASRGTKCTGGFERCIRLGSWACPSSPWLLSCHYHCAQLLSRRND